MANPVIIEIPENTVTKVATNVVTGKIKKHRVDGRKLYYYSTYRETGDPAPTLSEMEDEMSLMFIKHPEEDDILSTTAIDVYVIATLEDGKTQTGKLVMSL